MKQDKRWAVLDLLKAIIVVFMIVGHNLIWWFSENDGPILELTSFQETIMQFTFPFIALLVMCIPITAGAALRFSLQKYWDKKKQRLKKVNKYFYLSIFKRTLVFLALGYLLNFLAWTKESWLAWDVLQFYAVSFLCVSLFLRFFSIKWLLLWGGVILLATPLFRDIFSETQNYLKIILVSTQDGRHFWPMLPWLSIFIAGFYIGNMYFVSKKDLSKRLILLGSFFVILSIFSGDFFYNTDFKNVWGAALFQPSTFLIFGQIGFSFIFIGLLNFFYRNTSFTRNSIVNSFSHGIAPIYLFNIIVGSKITESLKYTENILMMDFSILLQLIISYFIGVGVIFYKNKNK